jgi:DNA-binding transcriptional ArsR family regulator
MPVTKTKSQGTVAEQFATAPPPASEIKPSQDSDQKAHQARRASILLKHVSDPTRLQVILLLAEGEQSVGALCNHLRQSQPTVSHHLALLRHGGIIAPRRQGKNNLYSLTELGIFLARLLGRLVDRAPSLHSVEQKTATERFEREVGTVVDDPRLWLNTPNPQFAGRRPIDLIGTEDEPELRNLIRAAQQGAFS